MFTIRKRSLILVTAAILFISSSLFGLSVLAKRPDNVSILMAAPFADSTSELVKIFNQKNRGRIHLEVI